MFESYIASLLDGYIGQYVEGFDLKQFGLRDTILRDLTIRSDAFSGLDIAVKVKCGNVGSIRLKIPVNILSYPIVIEIKDVFAVLIPERSEYDFNESRKKKFLKKMRGLEELAKSRLRNLIHLEDSDDDSWGWKWKSVLSRIVSNLKVSVERVHIRLEDNQTLRSEPFAMGMYLHSILVAPSPSDDTNKYVCQSSLQVSNAAVYLITSTTKNGVSRHVTHTQHSKRSSMRLHIKSSFVDALSGSIDCKSTSTMRFFMRKVFLVESPPSLMGLFIVKPADGIARLNILEPSQKTSQDEPIISVSIQTKPLYVHMNKAQYLALAGFVDTVSNFQLCARYLSSRPKSGPPSRKKKNTRQWWAYAIQATIKMRNRDLAEQNKKLWTSTQEYRECLTEWRVRYLLLYVRKLNGEKNLKQLDEMNRALEFHIIREFQEQSERIWAEQRERENQQSWISYLWNTEDEDSNTRAMIKEMERLVKHEKLHRNDHDDDDKNKKASTTVQDEDMLMRINVELSSVTFHLHFLTRPPSVMKLEFEKLQTMLTYRRKYFQVRACVGDALVSHDDGTRIYELVRRKRSTSTLSKSKNAIELQVSLPEYRTSIIEGPVADVAVMYRQESFDIVVATKAINRVQDFFATTQSLNHRVMAKWINQRLQIEALRQATFNNISSELLSRRRRFRLDINAAAPRLLIPEKYDQEDKDSCVLVVVDLGRLGILSSPSDKSRYDTIHVRSEKIRVVVMRTLGGDMWRNSTSSHALDTTSSENVLLDNLHLYTKIEVLAVDDRFRSNFIVQVDIPTVSLRFTQNVYARILQIYRAHLSQSQRRDQEKNMLETERNRGSSSSLRHSMSSSSVSNDLHRAASSNISTSSSFSEDENTFTAEDGVHRTARGIDARREVQLEELVLALQSAEQSVRTAADVDTLAQKTDFKLQVEIKELTLTLLRNDEKPFVISRTSGLLMTLSQRKFDTSATLSMRNFHLVEVSSSSNEENYIVQSPAPMIVDSKVETTTQEVDKHLFVAVSRYEPLSPKYVRAKGDIEIQFQMSHFAMTCKQSTLANLMDFLISPMSDKTWVEANLRKHHSSRIRRSLSIISKIDEDDHEESIPLHAHHSDGSILSSSKLRTDQRRHRSISVTTRRLSNSISPPRSSPRPLKTTGKHRTSIPRQFNSRSGLSMSGSSFMGNLAGLNNEDNDIVVTRVKEGLRKNKEGGLKKSSKDKKNKNKNKKKRNDEKVKMINQIRSRGLGPDHCRVYIVASAQAVSVRLEAESSPLCVFWAQDLLSEVAIAPCITEMRGHTGALCLKDLSPRVCCVEDRWRYIMIGRPSSTTSSSKHDDDDDEKSRFFRWSFRKTSKDSPFWNGHAIQMDMFFEAFTFTFRYRFYEEMWNFVYEGKLQDAFEKSKKKETIQNGIAVAGGIRDAASSTVRDNVLDSRSFPLIRYKSSEAEIIVPLAGNSRQSLSLVCDTFELETKTKDSKRRSSYKRSSSDFILLNRDLILVVKPLRLLHTVDDEMDVVDDVSTKESSHHVHIHHPHHPRRRSSINLDDFEDAESDFEDEDDEDEFVSADEEEEEEEHEGAEEDQKQVDEHVRKIESTCVRVAILAAHEAQLSSQCAERELDALLGRERILYDADLYNARVSSPKFQTFVRHLIQTQTLKKQSNTTPSQHKSVLHVRAQLQLLTHLIAQSHDIVTSAQICTQTLLGQTVADFDVCFESYWKGGVLEISQHFDKVRAVMSQQQLYALTDLLLCGNICELAVLCPTKPLTKTVSMKTTVQEDESKRSSTKFSEDLSTLGHEAKSRQPSYTSHEPPTSPYEPPPPKGPIPMGTPKFKLNSSSSSRKKMTPRKLLAQWLIGTRWARFNSENVMLGWIDFKYSNRGEIKTTDGSKSNITWSALSMRKIQIVDSQILTFYFNEKRTGFCCASNGHRGMLVSTQNGLREYRFLVPDDANAPTIQSLLKEGLFDTATTPSVFSTSRVCEEKNTFEADEKEEDKEEYDDDKEESTKEADIKRHNSTQSTVVSVKHRMRAAEQLNGVVAARWMTLNVSIENIELEVMSGHCGMKLSDSNKITTGHLGTLVAESVRVVSHKCMLGDDLNCTGLDTTVELKSIYLVGTGEDRVRCLEINGMTDSDSALVLTYGKRILPFTHSRPRRNVESIDSEEIDFEDVSPKPVTSTFGIQTFTQSSSTSKRFSTADMKLVDPTGGVSSKEFTKIPSFKAHDVNDGDDQDKATASTPDTLVGMSVKIGIASVYVTKDSMNVYDWYMYPTEEMIQAMSEEVQPALWIESAKYYQDFYCDLSFEAPIHIGLLEEYGAHVTNAIILQLTLALKYSYSIRQGVESMKIDATHVRASKVKVRGQIDWLPAPDISDTLQPFDLTFTNRTRPGLVANHFVQTRILNVSDVIIRTGSQDIKILWGVVSFWKSTDSNNTPSSPFSSKKEEEEEEEEEEEKNDGDEDKDECIEERKIGKEVYEVKNLDELLGNVSHQDRFARNVSREAAYVALRAARAAKAAQIKSMKLVMPYYNVMTQINVPFVCVTIINDFGFGGLPLAQFHFRFANLMLRDDQDLPSSKSKRSVSLSVVCSALGYSPNVSTWEELMSPWTLSVDMNHKDDEKTMFASDDNNQEQRILRRLSERSKSNIFIRTAGPINLTFTVALLNSFILSWNKFEREILTLKADALVSSDSPVSSPSKSVSSPHLLSRHFEDEMTGLHMFYLRVENDCGVSVYVVHEMRRNENKSSNKLPALPLMLRKSKSNQTGIETYLKSFTLRTSDVTQTSLPAHLQTVDFDSLKKFRRQQQEKRRSVYVHLPTRRKNKFIYAAKVPVDSLGHHLFDVDRVTIRVTMKRLRLPEGPRVSETNPVSAVMFLGGQKRRVLSSGTVFLKALYFENVDLSLVTKGQVSLMFLRHPFEIPKNIVGQVDPSSLQDLLFNKTGTDEEKCVGISKSRIFILPNNKTIIQRKGRVTISVETRMREIHTDELNVEENFDDEEEKLDDTMSPSMVVPSSSTEGCVIEMQDMKRDEDDGVKPFPSLTLRRVNLSSVLACDVTLEDGKKLLRARSLLVLRNRLNWSLDLKFSKNLEDQNTKLSPSMSKHVPFSYLNTTSSVMVRPSGSKSIKYDWAESFQCTKLMHMVLENSDVSLKGFEEDAGCDLKRICFFSQDDKNSMLWIYAMLSEMRNGTRVLSFHHVLRVQNLLPITLRIAVLATTGSRDGDKRQSVVGSTKAAQHDHEDEIELLSPMETFQTARPQAMPFATLQSGFSATNSTLAQKLSHDDDAVDDIWYAVLGPGEEALLSIHPSHDVRMMFSVPEANVKSRRKEPLVLPSIRNFLRNQKNGFPETVSGRFALHDEPDIELNLNFEMGFLFSSSFSVSERTRSTDEREIFLQVWCPLWIVNHTKTPLVFNFDPSKLAKSSQITVPYDVVDNTLSLFETALSSSSVPETKTSTTTTTTTNPDQPLSVTLFSPHSLDQNQVQGSFWDRTVFRKKHEREQKLRQNRLHVATRGIESNLYRRHHSDLKKRLSAQFILQNDTPYVLRFVKSDLGDDCKWHEQLSKITKSVAPGEVFSGVLIETMHSALPIEKLCAKLVFQVLENKQDITVTFTISTSRYSPGRFEHARMETSIPYHGAIRAHAKHDDNYKTHLNADLSSDSSTTSILAWTPTAVFMLYYLDSLSDNVVKHLRTSGILMKKGQYISMSSWKRRRFYCSAGGISGDSTRVVIDSENDGWPRLMWMKEEDTYDDSVSTKTNEVYKGAVVDGGTSYDVNEYFGKEECIRIRCPNRSFFVLPLHHEEREEWLSALDALFEVARARQVAAANSSYSLQGRWSKPFNYVLAGTQGSLQLQRSAADTRVFEFGVVNTKAPGRFYRSHIVHVTERFVFHNMCDFDIHVVQDGQPSDVLSLELPSGSAPKSWVWSDHRFLARSRRIRVRLRTVSTTNVKKTLLSSPTSSTNELGARPRTPDGSIRRSRRKADYIVSSSSGKKKSTSDLFRVSSVHSVTSSTNVLSPLFEEDKDKNVDYESRWLWSEPFSVDEVGRHQLKLWKVPKYIKQTGVSTRQMHGDFVLLDIMVEARESMLYVTFNNRSATNVPFQIRNECSMDTLQVIQRGVSQSLSTTVGPFESSPYFWDSLSSTDTFLNIFVLPLRLPAEVRGATKEKMKIVKLVSKKNEVVEREFAHDISIATVYKTHSSIQPVQNVNWGYRSRTLWIKNGVHITFRIVFARKTVSASKESSSSSSTKNLRRCHRLCVNPTIVGAGSRNVDGEIIECVVEEGPMVRNISLIVIAEGPTKVIIVSDMPQMYKPIYPFEPYTGGTRDMVQRKRRTVLESNKRFVKQLVSSNRKYLSQLRDVTSHSIKVLDDVRKTVEIENLEQQFNVSTKNKDNESETEWYLWVQPVEAFDLRPGSWPVVQIQSVFFKSTGTLMKKDKLKFYASCVYGDSGVAEWSENLEAGLCIPLCDENKRRSLEEIRSGNVHMTMIDTLWKTNRRKLKKKGLTDVMGTIALPVELLSDGEIHDVYCTIWKDVRRADQRRGVVRLRVMLCEAMHSPSVAVVSNSIHESGVFLEQVKIYNEIEKQLGYMGSIQSKESEQENTELFRSVMSMLFGGDAEKRIAVKTDIQNASRRNRAISVVQLLGTKESAKNEEKRFEDKKNKKEKRREKREKEEKEEIQDEIMNARMFEDENTSKKKSNGVSREMVVELQELRDLNVRAETGVYVALSLRRKDDTKVKKNLDGDDEDDEEKIFDNVSYSDVMFTQALTTQHSDSRFRDDYVVEEKEGDKEMEDFEMKREDDDEEEEEEFEQIFDVASTRFLGIWLRQHQRRLYVVRVSHRRRHNPRLRPGVRLIACRSEMTGDAKWHSLSSLTPEAARRKIWRAGRPVRLRFVGRRKITVASRSMDGKKNVENVVMTMTSHVERWAQALHLGPIQQHNDDDDNDVTLRVALYERNPRSNESVRVFDHSSEKLLTELATLYGDSQALADLKRSNFEKEPQAPEDRLIGKCNLKLSMLRDLSWTGSILLEDESSDEESKQNFSSRPTMNIQIKWTHSETRKDMLVSEFISINMPTIGISLVDNSSNGSVTNVDLTREVTYVGMRDLVATYVHFGDGRKTYKLSIQDLGVDNPFENTHYPSVVSPTQQKRGAEKNKENTPPWLSVYVDQMPPLYPATCFNVIHVSIGDMSLTLDSEWIYAVISFLDRLRLSVGSSRKMIVENSTMTSSSAVTRVVTEDMRTEYERLRSQLSSPAYSMPQLVNDTIRVDNDEIYIETLFVSSITCDLSLFIPNTTKLLNRVRFLNRFPRIRTTINAIAGSIANLENAKVKIKAVYRRNALSTPTALQTDMLNLLYDDVLSAVYKSMGSLDIIGNPVKLVDNISRGFYDLLYLPAQGLTVSPKAVVSGLGEGAISFVSNVSYGISHSLSVTLASLNRVIVVLTFDRKFMNERENRNAVIRNFRSASKWSSFEVAWQSLRVGMYGVWCTLRSTVTSACVLPYEQSIIRDEYTGSFKKCDPVGFGTGLIVGILGIGLKPAIAVLDTLAYAFQSVAIVSSGVVDSGSFERTRMRPPRYIDEKSGLVVAYVHHEAEGRRFLRKCCGDVDYVYHVSVASVTHYERHVVCLTTTHIMMLDTDQFEVKWRERLEHVTSFRVHQSEITFKIDSSSNDVTRTLKRSDTSRALRRFGSSRISEQQGLNSSSSNVSRTRTLTDTLLESDSTKRYFDLDDAEAKKDKTQYIKEGVKKVGIRRFACMHLSELRLFEWCYRKLRRSRRILQGYNNDGGSGSLTNSTTELVMRSRSKESLLESIRAKQILLSTLVDLSTLALEQVMSTHLRTLKIDEHDRVMKGLVMNIAEARLKHLVHTQKLRIVSVSVDLNRRAFGDMEKTITAKTTVVLKKNIVERAELSAFNLTVSASSLRGKATYKWVVLKSFTQIRDFVEQWRHNTDVLKIKMLLRQGCSILAKRRMSRQAGKQKQSWASFRRSDAKAQSFANQMTQVSFAQQMFDFLCDQDVLSVSHEFLRFLAEPDHFVGMDE